MVVRIQIASLKILCKNNDLYYSNDSSCCCLLYIGGNCFEIARNHFLYIVYVRKLMFPVIQQSIYIQIDKFNTALSNY